jgi:hypothetical protein
MNAHTILCFLFACMRVYSRLRSFQQAVRAGEHGVQHLRSQLSSRRVLLAGVIGADQDRRIRGYDVLAIVGENKSRAGPDHAPVAQNSEIRVERDFAEHDHHAQALEQIELTLEILAAVVEFIGRGFVGGRGAADGGGNICVREPHAVIARNAFRLRCEPSLEKRAIEKIAGAVAREHAAGAIASVRRGCESDDQQTGARVAKTRDRKAPVNPIAISASPDEGDLLAIFAKARAALTGDNFGLENF